MSLPFGIMLLAASVVGLCFGSFLNVVIHRVPIMIQEGEQSENMPAFTLATPRSHCTQCKYPIPFWGLIPIFGFLILGGKCHHCKLRISWRYPLVELVTMGMTFYIFATLGLTPLAFATTFFSFALIALLFIDLETQLLPDIITLPVLWVGLLLNSFDMFTSLHDAVIGAVLGYMALWTVAAIFRRLRGVEGMGYGDFKCTAMLGAWLGWEALPWILVIASLSGTVFAVGYLVKHKLKRTTPIAFGPFLTIAGFIYLMVRVL